MEPRVVVAALLFFMKYENCLLSNNNNLKTWAEEFTHDTSCQTPCGLGSEAIDIMVCQKMDRKKLNGS